MKIESQVQSTEDNKKLNHRLKKSKKTLESPKVTIEREILDRAILQIVYDQKKTISKVPRSTEQNLSTPCGLFGALILGAIGMTVIGPTLAVAGIFGTVSGSIPAGLIGAIIGALAGHLAGGKMEGTLSSNAKELVSMFKSRVLAENSSEAIEQPSLQIIEKDIAVVETVRVDTEVVEQSEP